VVPWIPGAVPQLKSSDGFFWVSLFKVLGFAKLRCKKDPLKLTLAVSPTEAAADDAVPEIARLPHNRCGRFKPNANATALVDISALGGNSTDDVLGGQYRCHVAATLTGRLPAMQLLVLIVSRPQACNLTCVIPEIDIWRAATRTGSALGPRRIGCHDGSI
jgi:hypothetical protein